MPEYEDNLDGDEQEVSRWRKMMRRTREKVKSLGISKDSL